MKRWPHEERALLKAAREHYSRWRGEQRWPNLPPHWDDCKTWCMPDECAVIVVHEMHKPVRVWNTGEIVTLEPHTMGPAE